MLCAFTFGCALFPLSTLGEGAGGEDAFPLSTLGEGAGGEEKFILQLSAADCADGNIPKAGTRLELSNADPPETGYSAAWKLTADKPGTFSIWLIGGGSGHFGKSVYSWSLDDAAFQPASNSSLVTPATDTKIFCRFYICRR